MKRGKITTTKKQQQQKTKHPHIADLTTDNHSFDQINFTIQNAEYLKISKVDLV